MSTVTVVLNIFQRRKHLDRQLEAIKSQSVAADEVLIWDNSAPNNDFNGLLESKDASTLMGRASRNLGVWSRFSFALNASSHFVCVLDDDTIPGSRWIENCLATMDTNEGLLGTRGLRFLSPKRAWPYIEYGWANPNEQIVQVDVVGHSWFFKRSWLSAFWGQYHNRFESQRAGEDFHFSYALYKTQGLGTYVPPHPPEDQSFYGSNPKDAIEIGFLEGTGISNSTGTATVFDQALRHYVKLGMPLSLSKNIRDGAERSEVQTGASVVILARSKMSQRIISSKNFRKTKAYKILRGLARRLRKKGIYV